MAGGFISSLFKKKVEEEEPSNLGLARVFKYDVLKKATNSFGTEIGSGGFGRVYLGKLPDGQQVAVKMLYDRNPKRIEQFFNEVTILSRLRHKNLITLYGCTNPLSQKFLLVYDYVPNGTVAEHLHDRRSELTLAVRMQIAVETASALSYLHALEPPIIHRDVKTSNILLDNALHAKVADLGICRHLPWDTTHVSTLPQGTLGYRDPDYDSTFLLTDKSDVYSLGVLLIELISGQQAVDVNRNPEDVYLDSLALKKISNKKLKDFVDPKLGYHSNHGVKRVIKAVAELAQECLHPQGRMRPSMVEVLCLLKQIQRKMLQIEQNAVGVKGTMDMTTLPALQEELNGGVEVVLPKKDDGGGIDGEKKTESGDGEKKKEEWGGGRGVDSKEGDSGEGEKRKNESGSRGGADERNDGCSGGGEKKKMECGGEAGADKKKGSSGGGEERKKESGGGGAVDEKNDGVSDGNAKKLAGGVGDESDGKKRKKPAGN